MHTDSLRQDYTTKYKSFFFPNAFYRYLCAHKICLNRYRIQNHQRKIHVNRPRTTVTENFELVILKK